MSNTKIVETSMMYKYIEDIDDPKTVLETLSKLESEMGWHDSKDVRLWTYGLWLSRKGKSDWYDYYVFLINSFKLINIGKIPDEILEEPKGWISPIQYFNGDKHD
jgi:hypothetical protein